MPWWAWLVAIGIGLLVGGIGAAAGFAMGLTAIARAVWRRQ